MSLFRAKCIYCEYDKVQDGNLVCPECGGEMIKYVALWGATIWKCGGYTKGVKGISTEMDAKAKYIGENKMIEYCEKPPEDVPDSLIE